MSDLELIIKRDSLNNKYLANYATDETGQRWVNKKLVDEEIKELEARVNHFKQCYFNAQRLVIRELVSESEQDEAMSNLLDELK